MKNLFFTFILSVTILNAQVPKKVVVEHFTNTKCSVCAARNPGFYTNLNSQNNVIHLAVHPSSPYSGCVLSQHNPVENDGRTNYYGVYGSTPRLVIQGVVIPSSADYNSSSMFAPYLAQQSPASIKIAQSKFANDSIRSRIVIKTEATHTLGALRLFVALAEDTLHYTGTNTEPVHYDVFRKSLTGTAGVSVTLPATVGDSLVYIMSSPSNGAWNFSRIFTMAILQETANKTVVQSESVPATQNVPAGISETILFETNVNIYAFERTIFIDLKKVIQGLNLTIHDLNGRVVHSQTIDKQTQQIKLSDIEPGIYFFRIRSEGTHVKTGKILLK